MERLGRRLRGHEETIGQRMERGLEALLPLPAVPYDASDKHVSRVSSLSLVRYRTSDYSVPVAYGHRDVLVRGYVGEVVISCGAEVIARHPSSYERDDFVFDPVHYLPLLERKTGALDQACSFGRVGVAGGVRCAEASAGVPYGQARQAGVRTGAAVDGELPNAGGVRGRTRRHSTRGHKLRRHQAPGAVQGGGPSSATRPGSVPLPAQGHRDEDSSQRLHGAHAGSGR